MILKGIEILSDKDPRLRQKSAEIADIKELDWSMIEKMKDLQIPRKVLGLSAVQLGYLVRVIMFKYGNTWDFLVNPVIVRRSNKTAKEYENCLSIDEGMASYPVTRAKIVKVEGLNIYGIKKRIKAHGQLARMLQHEIDHLDGKLISDYLDEG
jgi:peptide deformylase